MCRLEQGEPYIKISDIMTNELISVDENNSVIDTASKMTEHNISAILIRQGGELVGIVTDRDIIRKVVSKGLDPQKIKAAQIMSAPLITISSNASIEEAAQKMRDKKIRRLIVEEKNRKTGLITESDIVRFDPELHLLIREYSSLAAQLTPREPYVPTVTGTCEDCRNFSTSLMKVHGKWLCEVCRGE